MTAAKRIHRTLSERREQLETNIMAWKGGRPYVSKRLWRAPNESDLSWIGRRFDDASKLMGNATESFTTSGRKQRAALVNDAGRVVSKITQYLFKKAAERSGIGEDWAKDVTGSGTSVGNFWVDVSELLTAGQWVWLQADRMGPAIDSETGQPRERTLLEKQRDGDVVRWTAWPSVCVPDWSFAPDGSLLWIITEGSTYDNADPEAEAKVLKIRTLWRRTPSGYSTRQYVIDTSSGGGVVVRGEMEVAGPSALPFVLVGSPSTDPWWFDDVEGLQAQLLNLDSLHFENLVRTVFPQLVIPQSTLESLQMRLIERNGAANGEKIIEVVKELIRGLDSPIVESADESGITRFIQPNKQDQETIPNELARKRSLLFDMVGLSLFNKETRQIQTAESKQFDQLDTESTLKHRALIMQSAEHRMVELSKEIDPAFSEYEAVWPSSFDVVDVSGDSAAITMLGNLPGVTPTMQKMVMLSALRIISDLGGYDQELVSQAREEILSMVDDGGESAMTDTTGKIPLAIQQLALARERAVKSGDDELAKKLDEKIDQLTARV